MWPRAFVCIVSVAAIAATTGADATARLAKGEGPDVDRGCFRVDLDRKGERRRNPNRCEDDAAAEGSPRAGLRPLAGPWLRSSLGTPGSRRSHPPEARASDGPFGHGQRDDVRARRRRRCCLGGRRRTRCRGPNRSTTDGTYCNDPDTWSSSWPRCWPRTCARGLRSYAWAGDRSGRDSAPAATGSACEPCLASPCPARVRSRDRDHARRDVDNRSVRRHTRAPRSKDARRDWRPAGRALARSGRGLWLYLAYRPEIGHTSRSRDPACHRSYPSGRVGRDGRRRRRVVARVLGL